MLEQREMENRARLEWLSAAVEEGIDDLERGDYVTLHSRQEIDDWMSQVHETKKLRESRRSSRSVAKHARYEMRIARAARTEDSGRRPEVPVSFPARHAATRRDRTPCPRANMTATLYAEAGSYAA